MNTTTQKVLEWFRNEVDSDTDRLGIFLFEWRMLPTKGATPIRRFAKFLANPYEAVVLYLDAREITETEDGINFADGDIDVPAMNAFLLEQLEDGRGDDRGFGLNSSNNIMGDVEQGWKGQTTAKRVYPSLEVRQLAYRSELKEAIKTKDGQIDQLWMQIEKLEKS